MSRYFIEVAYNGFNYSGFQVQENANTIQAEVEKAFATIEREKITLTGSSRTDAGVHALQNFFHFDIDKSLQSTFIYKMNALLPWDITIKNVYKVDEEAHCRFDAIGRSYIYKIHKSKDPFKHNLSYYYPYTLDSDAMQKAIGFIKGQHNFFGFAKSNTQVSNFSCTVQECNLKEDGGNLEFLIKANRFLRGMVRSLMGSVLKVGRGKITVEQFERIFDGEEKCGFSVPGYGLYLMEVEYPENYFSASGLHFTAF
jgi:tRNA pseudouridine38-40 synthase